MTLRISNLILLIFKAVPVPPVFFYSTQCLGNVGDISFDYVAKNGIKAHR